MLKLGEVVDAGEVSRLRGEVCDLGVVKASLEKSVEELTRENNAAADRAFKLLTEKSELITECDSLSVSVKDLKSEVCGLKAALDASREEIAMKEKSWISDKSDLVAKLDETHGQLARSQAESFKSFEEGYGECVARFAGVGVDVKGHSFECYLADLQNKVSGGGTGSSSRPDGA